MTGSEVEIVLHAPWLTTAAYAWSLGVVVVIVVLLFRSLNSRTAVRQSKPDALLPETSRAKPSFRSWDGARPLGCEVRALTSQVAASQLGKLRDARALVERLEAAKATSTDIIEFSFKPDKKSNLDFSLAFVEGGDLYFSEQADSFPLGLLPALTLWREVEIVVTHLPRLLRRQVDKLEVKHAFAPNDQLYSVRYRGVGPIPSIDDFVNATLFDVCDVPDERGAVLIHISDPQHKADSYRGVALPPPPSGYKRNHGLSIVCHLTPSRGGADLPHGRLDLTVIGKIHLPVSRWLLPTPLIR